MRGVWVLLAVVAFLVAAAGCGGSQPEQRARGDTLRGYGIGIDLPSGWSGRIPLGTTRLPMLHARDYPLPPGDSDWGDEVQEEMGSRGVYLNVQQLAGTRAGAGGLPVAFERSDLRAGSLRRALVYPGHVYARRLVAVDGRGYQVTAVYARTPSGAKLTDANSVLATLRLVPYEPAPVVRAGGRLLHGRGIALRLPAGWRGSISGGIVHATSAGGSRLGPRDLSLDLREFSSAVGPGWNSPLPVSLGASEFVRPEYVRNPPVESVRYLRAAGRWFRLTAISGGSPPDSATLEEANAALATLSVRPGDF